MWGYKGTLVFVPQRGGVGQEEAEVETPLLTKPFIVPVRPGLVARPRLMERLIGEGVMD